jgi:hypothetical protein
VRAVSWLFTSLITLFVGACAYLLGCSGDLEVLSAIDAGDDEMRESANNPTEQVKGGWSQSGDVLQFSQSQRVKCQANLPYSRYYTIQFNVQPPSLITFNNVTIPFAFRAVATIKWSVEGNLVTRVIDVGNGVSISGPGQGFQVQVQDMTAVPVDGPIQTGWASLVTIPPLWLSPGNPGAAFDAVTTGFEVGQQIVFPFDSTFTIYTITDVNEMDPGTFLLPGTLSIIDGSPNATFSAPQNITNPSLPSFVGVNTALLTPDGAPAYHFIKEVVDSTHVVFYDGALATVAAGSVSTASYINFTPTYVGSFVDDGDFWFAQEYVVSIQVSEGTRPTITFPPTLLGEQTNIDAAASTTISIPQNSGINSVEVVVVNAVGGGEPTNVIVNQLAANSITPVAKTYDPAVNTGFIAIAPNASALQVQNFGGAAVTVTITWGVDG